MLAAPTKRSRPELEHDTKRRRINPSRPPQPPPPGIVGSLQNAFSWVSEAMSRPFRDSENTFRRVQPVRVTARNPIPGMGSDPRGSLAALTRSSDTSVIVVDDASEIDPEEDRMRVLQRAKANEAKRHLNDLQAGSSIHPLLTRPLFNSEISRPGPSRPDVTYSRPERQRDWARPESPSSSSSSSSSSRRRHRSSIRRESASQLRLLSKLIDEAEASGASNLSALKRTREELLRDKRPSRVPTGDSANRQSITGAFKGLHLDNRKQLDDAIVRPKKTFQPPRTGLKPRPFPKPVEFEKSELYQKIKREDAASEKLLQKRLKVQIPAHLSPDQDAIANERLRDSQFKATVGSAEVDAAALRRLRSEQWLNDDIINFYMELINARAKEQDVKVVAMNTFFYQKLSEQGYAKANLKRWTKRMKLDIFSLDKFLVPINIKNSHWTCAVIDFQKKRIEYYDSLSDHGHRLTVFKNLRSYLEAEHKEKKGTSFDLSGWKDSYRSNTPRQNNMSDCGVFACQTLETVARGRDLISNDFEFKGENMEFFRRLMVIEIASGALSERFWSPR